MAAPTPFHDPAEYVQIPRLTGAVLSPDGNRVIGVASSPDPEGRRYVSALWDLDPAGRAPARRLTRSAKGEGSPAFLPNGDVLFVSSRPDPTAKEPNEDAVLWLLPAAGGEARVVAARKGGFGGVVTAKAADTVLVPAGVIGGSLEQDASTRSSRKELGVTGILYEEPLVRYWDHELGPEETHLLVTNAPAGEEWCPPLRDAVPGGRRLLNTHPVLTADGTAVVVDWSVPADPGDLRNELHVIDLTTGAHRVIAGAEGVGFEQPGLSPDGRLVCCTRSTEPAFDRVPDVRPWVLPFDGSSDGSDPCPSWDRWASELHWSADGRALFAVADDHGHAPVFRIDLANGHVVQLTAAGAHTGVQVSPDGRWLYALRTTMDQPPHVARYDTTTPMQAPTVLPSPAGCDVPVPGRLQEVHTTAADGTPLRAWLALPEGDPDEAGRTLPLMVWVHGGPLGSWNAWSWRWNPWVAVARGYAVLLPDPAFSTGYGLGMVQRGWGQWGGNPYTDVMALVDATVARPDIDTDRTCLLGGSYGGYFANWTAVSTDRFRCIVTHASIWALDQFGQTTDMPGYWRKEWGDPGSARERMQQWSPHLHAERITTPMLVIHGDRDYRVPIGEALRLWDDLMRLGKDAKFLSFPTENHWILNPGNARVWYETVLAFCDHHVLGRDWVRPSLL